MARGGHGASATTNAEDNLVRVKTVLVGDGSVGKTCMVYSYAENKFPTDYVPTVFDTFTATVHVDGRPRTLELLDTAGQEDYERLRALSYHETDVFILCYSIVHHPSLENIERRWAPEIKRVSPGSHMILCGCKMDLRTDPVELERLAKRGQKPVTTSEGEKVARNIGADSFFECSALTQEGLKDVFDEALLSAWDPLPKPRKGARAAPKSACCTIV